MQRLKHHRLRPKLESPVVQQNDLNVCHDYRDKHSGLRQRLVPAVRCI